jgi:hypothetical protein
MDSTVDESQFINVDEMLDPLGKCSIELEKAFKSIDFSPSKEVISNILMNA